MNYKPTKDKVFVITEPMPKRTEGGIHIIQDKQGLYGERGAPHNIWMKAKVIAVGPDAKLDFEVGDRLMFTRLHFAWVKKVDSERFIGYVPAEQVQFKIDDEDVVSE